MKHCFFIGIGGTGAKCAEALIHLSAAGLGPDKCEILLVDQDEPNGNGQRCQGLLDTYIQLRGQVTSSTTRSDGDLFRTEIAGSSWCPAPRGSTLGQICGYAQLQPQQKEWLY